MYNETIIQILGNSPTNTSIKSIYADYQVFEKTIKIEGYEFNITKRGIVDRIEILIDVDTYLDIEGTIYKVMKVKTYSDYMELWLYKLNKQK